MRGVIPEDTMEQICQGLPEAISLHDKMPVHWSCDPLTGSGSRVRDSLRELWDGWHLLCEARFALVEAEASKLWYAEFRKPPTEVSAIYFRRYYLDDAVLRLYASRQHMLGAIKMCFGLKTRHHEGTALGKVIAALSDSNTAPNALLSLQTLASCERWARCVKYRNDWFHNERPSIEGLGPRNLATYKHTETPEYREVTFGGGPVLRQIKLETLAEDTRGAYVALFAAYEQVVHAVGSAARLDLPRWATGDDNTSGEPTQCL